ncbi:MAG: hypothetical protein DRQ60_04285 [Gammaproteobacteria bacterium]|nr:MAG: hypothetical protein DRQ60_04285 [Gammaproteobacteria bacterium]
MPAPQFEFLRIYLGNYRAEDKSAALQDVIAIEPSLDYFKLLKKAERYRELVGSVGRQLLSGRAGFAPG